MRYETERLDDVVYETLCKAKERGQSMTVAEVADYLGAPHRTVHEKIKALSKNKEIMCVHRAAGRTPAKWTTTDVDVEILKVKRPVIPHGGWKVDHKAMGPVSVFHMGGAL